MGSLSLLQGIFLTQGSNLGLLHCSLSQKMMRVATSQVRKGANEWEAFSTGQGPWEPASNRTTTPLKLNNIERQWTPAPKSGRVGPEAKRRHSHHIQGLWWWKCFLLLLLDFSMFPICHEPVLVELIWALLQTWLTEVTGWGSSRSSGRSVLTSFFFLSSPCWLFISCVSEGWVSCFYSPYSNSE